MKANESKIAFICFHLFFRIGTFQRVTAEKNKKFSRRLNSPPRLCARPLTRMRHLVNHPQLSFRGPAWVTIQGKARQDSIGSEIRTENVALFALAVDRAEFDLWAETCGRL
jgi:hypothetical protein